MPAAKLQELAHEKSQNHKEFNAIVRDHEDRERGSRSGLPTSTRPRRRPSTAVAIERQNPLSGIFSVFDRGVHMIAGMVSSVTGAFVGATQALITSLTGVKALAEMSGQAKGLLDVVKLGPGAYEATWKHGFSSTRQGTFESLSGLKDFITPPSETPKQEERREEDERGADWENYGPRSAPKVPNARKNDPRW